MEYAVKNILSIVAMVIHSGLHFCRQCFSFIEGEFAYLAKISGYPSSCDILQSSQVRAMKSSQVSQQINHHNMLCAHNDKKSVDLNLPVHAFHFKLWFYFFGLKVNFWPPMDASYISPPLA